MACNSRAGVRRNQFSKLVMLPANGPIICPAPPESVSQNHKMFRLCTVNSAQGDALIKTHQTALVFDGQAQQIQVGKLFGALHVGVPKGANKSIASSCGLASNQITLILFASALFQSGMVPAFFESAENQAAIWQYADEMWK